MATPNIYKSIEESDLKSIIVTPLTNEKKNEIKTTITNFVTYLKNAHS